MSKIGLLLAVVAVACGTTPAAHSGSDAGCPSGTVQKFDPDTGKLKWHFQFTPNDNYDYDSVQVPVLVDSGAGADLEIFDSTQIFEYLETVKPEPALWPADPRARTRARLLKHKSDEVYFPPIVRLMGLQDRPDDPAAIEARTVAACF